MSVGVVDADLGQSDIGPPTTVGLGRLCPPVERLADAEVLGLYFVGSTSPQGHLLPTVLGTRMMTEKALRLGLDRVIVDTSGLVKEVWILRPEEAAVRPWPTTPAEAQAWLFDPAAQVWTKP